jgi:hypothetical protein
VQLTAVLVQIGVIGGDDGGNGQRRLDHGDDGRDGGLGR